MFILISEALISLAVGAYAIYHTRRDLSKLGIAMGAIGSMFGWGCLLWAHPVQQTTIFISTILGVLIGFLVGNRRYECGHKGPSLPFTIKVGVIDCKLDKSPYCPSCATDYLERYNNSRWTKSWVKPSFPISGNWAGLFH